MSKDLIAQLKQLKHGEVKPSEAWLKNNRAVLLSQIKNTVSNQNSKINLENVWNAMALFMPRPVVFNVVRPMAVLLVVSIVATSGWITGVDAAYNALPGDWLYPAKRAAEKTQVVMAAIVGAKKAETKLHAEFAKRRADETKQILNGNDPGKQAKAQETVSDLKIEIASVNQKLDEIKSDSTKNVTADVVKDVKQDTDSVKNTLQEVKTSLLATAAQNTSTTPATNAAAQTVQAVSEVKDLAKDASVKAVEVMVTKHLEGDVSVSVDDVKKEINTTLQSNATDAAQSSNSVDKIKDVVNAAKTQAADLSADKSSNTSSTVALTQKISEISTATNVAVAQTKTAVETTDQAVAKGVDSLNKGDLAQAIQAVKDVNNVTKEAEKISDKTIVNAAQLVPVSPVVAAVDSSKDVKVIFSTSTSSTPEIKVILTPATSTINNSTTTTKKEKK
ncbi:MAG: hypothetical protein HY979_00910 [Candidatus Magasanikbacteria bacterium]|nr:hypothetical protein [Candidatus Magasanikbacteria bacterium]